MEAFNYIEALADVGTSIGSTSEGWPYRNPEFPQFVAVSEDWANSFAEVRKYWEQLDGLDYNTLFFESKQPNAKVILEMWESSRFPVSMKWLAENYRMLYREMAKALKDWKKLSDDFFYRGKWSIKERDDFIPLCWQIDLLWKKRINELLRCYGYSEVKFRNMSDDLKERNSDVLRMFADAKRYDEFFGTKEKNISQWGKKAASFAAKGWFRLDYGNPKKLYDYLISVYPEIETKSGFNAFRRPFPKIR
ncbi:MAG: hypothetical protein IKS94_01065 [Prevotella sp.]|nr:hypothetical protein [Prevotella sp.]